MAPRIRIRCVNKIPRMDPHKSIERVGGVNSDGTRWRQSQQQTIQEIETGAYEFFVQEGGHVVDVIVAKYNGNKYIKTKPDGDFPDNLLALPECP